MNKLTKYFAVPTALSIIFVVAFAGSALGQSRTSTVDARQSGPWSVGIDPDKNVISIDPTKNTVQLSNSQADPLPVKVIGSASARKPFQTRMILSPSGTGFESAHMPIPAGKRLVIEHVSAIARCPEGLRMEINYFSYFDNNGDGVGDVADITFHRMTLTDQGTFSGTAISTANHKVLVFADEQIGASHFTVGVQARLNGTTTVYAQAQITFSGYLEDLPAVP